MVIFDHDPNLIFGLGNLVQGRLNVLVHELSYLGEKCGSYGELKLESVMRGVDHAMTVTTSWDSKTSFMCLTIIYSKMESRRVEIMYIF